MFLQFSAHKAFCVISLIKIEFLLFFIPDSGLSPVCRWGVHLIQHAWLSLQHLGDVRGGAVDLHQTGKSATEYSLLHSHIVHLRSHDHVR